MAELTKDKIMRTANGLFLKDGVREVSIDDICRNLCISKKTFYEYYARKEDLVADVVTYNVEMKKAEFERLVEGKDVVQILKAMFSMVSRKKTIDKDKRMAKDISKYYPETFLKRTEERYKAMYFFLMECLNEGEKSGLVRPDIDFDGVQFFICIMHDGMADYLEGRYHIDGFNVPFKSLAAAFEDIVTRSLLTQKGLEKYSSLSNDNNS
jgi:AcrR family transcriptional regulator